MLLKLRTDLGGLSFRMTNNINIKDVTTTKIISQAVSQLTEIRFTPVQNRKVDIVSPKKRKSETNLEKTANIFPSPSSLSSYSSNHLTEEITCLTPSSPSSSSSPFFSTSSSPASSSSLSSPPKMVKLRMGKKPTLPKEQMELNDVSPIVQIQTPIKNSRMEEEVGQVRFSNSMKDAVKVVCKICSSAEFLTGLRNHTRNKHKMSITDYKQQYGKLELVELVQHKCQLCAEVITLDADEVARHVKRSHRDISHKEYSARPHLLRGNSQQTGVQHVNKVRSSGYLKTRTTTVFTTILV